MTDGNLYNDEFSEEFGDVLSEEANGGPVVDIRDERDRDALPAIENCESLLRELSVMVEDARQLPMSQSIVLNQDEALDLVDQVMVSLPEELRSARWVLKDREEIISKANREAAEVIDEAKSNAARLVERQEVVRHANQKAQSILDEAEDHARRMRHESEDYCDQKLAKFEIVLEKLQGQVAGGRRKLQATIDEAEKSGVYDTYADAETSDAQAFFDQTDELTTN